MTTQATTPLTSTPAVPARASSAERGQPAATPDGARARERGSVAVELGVGAVIWVIAVLVLGAVYQLTTSSDDVADAAAQAARAASLTAAPADAIDTATALVHQRLAVGACAPASVSVAVDVSDFRAAGTVTVTVACRTRPRIGPARTLRSTADEVIDTYRGGL